MAWQEYQRQAMLAAQEHERRLAYEGWLVEQQRQQRLKHLKTLGDLLARTPTEFELAIADLLPSLGFVNVEHTGKAGDFGVDIQCLTRSGRKVLVQCKQYGFGNKVSRPEVQAFMGALMHFGAEMGLFITTSSFTHEARVLAHEHAVMAVDGEMLTQLIHKVQETLDQQPS
jgi:restriction endonuclease Mrr